MKLICYLHLLLVFFASCNRPLDSHIKEKEISVPASCHQRILPADFEKRKLHHPGTTMSMQQLHDLATILNETQPTKQQAVDQLLQQTLKDFQPTVVENLKIDYEKTDEMKRQHRVLVEESSVQAYLQAIAFIVTCDEAYAKKSLQILHAWSTNNKSFSGENAPLEAAWAVSNMARAAELLKYTYRDWDILVEERFLKWTKNLLEPQINRQVQWQFNKWHNTGIQASLKPSYK